MFDLFVKTAADCSRNVTQTYSTSFSFGIKTLDKKFHAPIYGIYGMVRYADEIVDTFHDYDKEKLIRNFKRDTFEAIDDKISLNPILFSFQQAVNEYQIPLELVEAFFKSMEMDLNQTAYGEQDYQEYIYGSAEVVGLMCLKVFSERNQMLYDSLKVYARALGAAFQKVNFLRDMKSDFDERGRVYFPEVDFNHFKEEAKRQIELEIDEDFKTALDGIKKLPITSQAGVYLAYKYYMKLFGQIKRVPVSALKETRIRVPDSQKMIMLLSSIARRQFGSTLAA